MSTHCLAQASVGAASAANALCPCCFRAKSGRSPSATELLFSCVATPAPGARANSAAGPKGGGQDARSKRKVTKREGHPAWRLPGIHARQVREAGSGFSTAHPCAGEKESTSCRFPLRGLSTPPHRRTGAPGRAADHPDPHSSQDPRQELPPHPNPLPRQSRGRGSRGGCVAAAHDARGLAVLKSAGHDGPLLCRGPCAAVRDGRQAAQRASTRMSMPFRQGRMPCRKARPALTDLPGRKPGKRQAGWPFSLATQRESDSVAAGDRPLFALKTTKASRLKSLLQMRRGVRAARSDATGPRKGLTGATP